MILCRAGVRALACAVVLVPMSAAAQPAAPAAAVCAHLVAFLQEHPLRPRDDTPVTLEEALRFLREDNRFACRSAIHGLYVAGVPLPPLLRDAIGLPP